LAPIKQIEENASIEIIIEKLIESIYSIKEDDVRMRKMLMMNQNERKKYFDLQRKIYPVRREFDNYSINSEKLSKRAKHILENMRFKIIT
jgi:erythronate-4-phosphate dehydrogenase